MIDKAKFVYYVARGKTTQRKVAEVIGVTPQALYAKLCGKVTFRLSELIAMGLYLSLSRKEFEEMVCECNADARKLILQWSNPKKRDRLSAANDR